MKLLLVLTWMLASPALASGDSCISVTEDAECGEGYAKVIANLDGGDAAYCFETEGVWILKPIFREYFFDDDGRAKAEFYRKKETRCEPGRSFCRTLNLSPLNTLQKICDLPLT